jgi:hypothetical protein
VEYKHSDFRVHGRNRVDRVGESQFRRDINCGIYIYVLCDGRYSREHAARQTQRLLLFGPLYNNITTTSLQGKRETKWKNFTGKSTDVKKLFETCSLLSSSPHILRRSDLGLWLAR